MLDLLIVGAGPAGVSAALWARSLGLDVRVLDAAPHVGGQLHRIFFHPEGIAGLEDGDGADLARRHASQLEHAGIPVETGVQAAGLVALSGNEEPVQVRIADGTAREARAAIVATGLRRRHLDVPGEGKFEDRGVYASATQNTDALAGRDVIVVGGGDAGFENALILYRAGSRVTLLVRDEAHARSAFQRQVSDAGIEVLDHTSVVEILGNEVVEGVRVERRGEEFTRAASAVVVKVGNLPNTEWCREALTLDHEGYVEVGATLQTSAPRIWAAGDVTRPGVPAIPVATGQGALAASAVRDALDRP